MRYPIARSLTISALLAGMTWGQYYDGPSVLSQGGASRPYGVRAGKDRNIRVYGSISGIVDSGFFPISVDDQVIFGTRFGAEASAGLYGVKRFQRGSFGIDYNGAYRNYGSKAYFNGSDHYLGADAAYQKSSRLSLKGQTTLGTSSRVFSFANVVGGGLGAGFLPINDLFDARVYFGRASGSAEVMLTRRLQLDLMAEGFTVRRANALVGVNGYSPGASLSYRFNRKQWIGGFYNFIHFDYPKAFGESDLHLMGGTFVHNFTKNWQVETLLGVYRTDIAGKRRVEADPIVQQLLGIRFITEAFSRASTLPYVSVGSRTRTKNGDFSFRYQKSPTGGNGVMLTAASETFSGVVSFSNDRRWSVSFSNSLMRSKSVGNEVAGLSSYFAASSGSYRLGRGIQLFGNMLYRHTNVIYANYPRNTYRSGVGITIGSGELPVSFW